MEASWFLPDALYKLRFQVSGDQFLTEKLYHQFIYLVTNSHDGFLRDLLKSIEIYEITDDCGKTVLHLLLEEMLTKERPSPPHIGLTPYDLPVAELIRIFSKYLDLNTGDENRITPLLFTLKISQDSRYHHVFKDCFEICEALLKNDADINKPDSNGNSAVHYISEFEFPFQMRLFNLIAQHPSANFRLRNLEMGNTPLHLVNDEDYLMRLLETTNADINLQNYNGETPIMYHLKSRHIKLSEILVKAGADFNIPDVKGNYPLFQLGRMNIEIVKELVESGRIDINQTNRWGQTILSTIDIRYRNLADFLDLPFQPEHLLEVIDEGVEKKIFEKWDNAKVMDPNFFPKLLNHFTANIRFREPRIIIRLWRFLEENRKNSVADETYRNFFISLCRIPFAVFVGNVRDSGVAYEQFLSAFIDINDGNFLIKFHDVIGLFRAKGDSALLRKMIKYQRVQLNDLEFNMSPFIYALYNTRFDLNSITNMLEHIALNDVHYFDLEHLARHCRFYKRNHITPKKFFEPSNAKSLKELARNATRRHLSVSFDVHNAGGLDAVLRRTVLPKDIRRIIMLECTLYNN